MPLLIGCHILLSLCSAYLSAAAKFSNYGTTPRCHQRKVLHWSIAGLLISLFGERELMFTFAIWYRQSVCLSSVACLSVVCNARAPYSSG